MAASALDRNILCAQSKTEANLNETILYHLFIEFQLKHTNSRQIEDYY